MTCLVGSALLMMATDVQAITVASSPTATVVGHAPTLQAGQITFVDENKNGVLDTGDVVKIDDAHQFIFSDIDGDTPTNNTYSWKVDGKEVSTAGTYTIKDEDLNKSVGLEVTPHTDATSTDPAIGIATQATGNLPIVGGDTVTAVAITGGSGTAGAPVVKDTLKATPTCSKTCGTLNYQWRVETAVGSGEWEDITGATNATWVVTGGVQKRKVQVRVSNPASKTSEK
ncbi:hypothetical protein CJP72_10230 [Citrobacter sp. NCU1]|uniref:ZirU family protein n=1 Tax=Citrobacter sp. NCU1 TaxID=2026683 RepID=UPI001390EB71|nr:ZirU family protein [Citrobacter sp. NCU1]NDO81128.1 hypothetical protein [Citrobacter sp. NCU1]